MFLHHRYNTKVPNAPKPAYTGSLFSFAGPSMPTKSAGEMNKITAQRYMNKLLPNIKIGNKIGSGFHGIVYKGTSNRNGNLAVKIQNKNNSAKTELQALKKLNGLNITPKFVRHASDNSNRVNILVSKFVNGTTLSKYESHIPQDIKNKVKNAIAKMHKAGVIHGDLHSENIMIGKNGKVYIIDVGKALITPMQFNTVNNSNQYLKSVTGRFADNWGKRAWYSTSTKRHFANGNFVRRVLNSNPPPTATIPNAVSTSKFKNAIKRAMVQEGMKVHVAHYGNNTKLPYLRKYFFKDMKSRLVNIPTLLYRGTRWANMPKSGEIYNTGKRSLSFSKKLAEATGFTGAATSTIYVLNPGKYPAMNISNYITQKFPPRATGLLSRNDPYGHLNNSTRNLVSYKTEYETVFPPGKWLIGGERHDLKDPHKKNRVFKDIFWIGPN